MIRRIRRVGWRGAGAAALGGVLAVSSLAACGSDDSGGEDPSSDEPVTISVGVIPIADVAPMYVGMAEGFFEEEGLIIEAEYADGGAAIVPAVVGGDYEFGFSNIVSLINATEEGLPVTIVTSAGDEATTEEEAFAGLIVAEDSPVQELSDLAGGTIAVNSLLNINQLAIQASFEARGLPFEDLNFTEIPIPDMPAAVETGQVDAAMTSEPFVTIADDTTRVIAASYFDVAPGLSVAQFFTTEQYRDQNPEVVAAFQRAMNRSLDFAQQNPDRAREEALEYTSIDPAVVEAMNLPGWSSTLNVESIEHVAQLMADYGFTDDVPELDRLLAGID